MRKCTIAAALAAAALFGLTAIADTPASAQNVVDVSPHAVDPSAVQPGAAALRPPMPALGSEYATPTQYEPDGEVGVPYGDWISSVMAWVLGIVGVIAAWLLRFVPDRFVGMLDAFSGMLGQGRANELLEKAITYGINTTAGAVKGKTLTVKVGNEVLERAFEYAVRHAPGLVAQLGGLIHVREKIIARLDLEADAAVPTPRPPADTLISADG